jgi:two-component system, NarL family, invasion response regulator UvrY
MKKNLHVILIDPQLMYAQSLKSMLLMNGINEVTIFNSGQSFIDARDLDAPQVVVMEIMLPDIGYQKMVAHIREKFDESVEIMILATMADIQTCRVSFKHGIKGFLSKSVTSKELLEAISVVSSGKKYVEASLKNSLFKNTPSPGAGLVYHLTNREQEALEGICKGFTTKQIAEQLDLSIFTVKYYIRSLMKKLGAHRKPDLIVEAIKSGLFIPEEAAKKEWKK